MQAEGRYTSFFATNAWFSCLQQEGFAEPPALRIYSAVKAADVQRPECHLYLREDSRNRRLQSLTNAYSVMFPGVVPDDAVDRAALGVILRTIADERPCWAGLEFRFLPGWKGVTHALADGLRRVGYRVELEHHHWNWFVNVEGKRFAEYLTERPGRLRSTLERRRRRAAARCSIRFELVSDADRLEPAIAHYQSVYERSWKPTEKCPGFVPALMRQCAALGTLRLGLLYLDERPAAAQFWIVSGTQACIYKLAHDPQFDDLSAGTLLSGYMFEQVLERDRPGEVDFGVGDEAYKRDWMDRRRQLLMLRAINPRTLPGAIQSVRLILRSIIRAAGLARHVPVASQRPARR